MADEQPIKDYSAMSNRMLRMEIEEILKELDRYSKETAYLHGEGARITAECEYLRSEITIYKETIRELEEGKQRLDKQLKEYIEENKRLGNENNKLRKRYEKSTQKIKKQITLKEQFMISERVGNPFVRLLRGIYNFLND